MKDWKEKILQSDAGLARPDLAEELIAETEGSGLNGTGNNGAEVPELSPVGSPSQVSRSPELSEGIEDRVREEVLALAPVIKALVRKDIEEVKRDE